MILDRSDVSAAELLAYDIVICGQKYLTMRYKQFCKVQQPTNNGQRHPSVHMPLHSELYHGLDKPISVLIVDESQDTKNTNTLIAAALRSLKPLVTFCLSGTLIFNRWKDIYSQISLLPGCPFVSLKHFKVVFDLDSRLSDRCETAEQEQRAKTQGKITCPYCTKLGIDTKFENASNLVRHVREASVSAQHAQWVKEDGWLEPGWEDKEGCERIKRTREAEYLQRSVRSWRKWVFATQMRRKTWSISLLSRIQRTQRSSWVALLRA